MTAAPSGFSVLFMSDTKIMKTRDEINAQRRAHYAANREKLAAQRRVRDARYKARRKVRGVDVTAGLAELGKAITLVAKAWLKFKVPYVPKDAPYRLHPPTLPDLQGCKVMRIGPLTRALLTATL